MPSITACSNSRLVGGNKLENDVLPILQKQPGFVDFLTLFDRINPERLMFISFWTLREDAEEYHRQHSYLITDTLKPVLDLLRR